MSPAKRLSTAKTSTPKKQKKTALQENLDVLEKAFDNHEYVFPCVESLKELIPATLSTPSERRHEYQIKAFNMVEEAVCEAQETLETQQSKLQSEISDCDKVKQEMEASIVATEEKIKAIEEEIEANTSCVNEASTRRTDGQTNLDAELQSIETERVEYDKHQANYADLDSKFSQLFLDGALKNCVNDVNNHRKSMEKLIKKFIPEDASSPIVQSAFSALYQDPKIRSAFDKHTLDLFEDIFENRLSAIKKDIVRTTPEFTKRDELQQEVETLAKVLQDEQEKLNGTKDSHKQLQAQLREIKKNVKNHPQKVQDAQDSLTEISEALENFKQFVVPANQFIQNYTEEVVVMEDASEKSGSTEPTEMVEQPPKESESIKTPQKTAVSPIASTEREENVSMNVLNTPQRESVKVNEGTPEGAPEAIFNTPAQ